VGVALSDPTATIAQALTTVPAEPADTLATRIAEIARSNDAARIVVGLPRRLDGSHGPEAKAAQVLANLDAFEKSLEIARARRIGGEIEAGIVADLAEVQSSIGNHQAALALAREARVIPADELEQRLAAVGEALKAQPEHLVRRVEQLLEERERLEARLAETLRSGSSAAVRGDVSRIAGVELTIAQTATEDRAELGRIADAFREEKRNAVLVLFGSAGRGAIHVTLTEDLVSSGRKAGELVNRIAALSGGKGGGRPHFASAGAGDPERLPAARAATPALVAAWLESRRVPEATGA